MKMDHKRTQFYLYCIGIVNQCCCIGIGGKGPVLLENLELSSALDTLKYLYLCPCYHAHKNLMLRNLIQIKNNCLF